MAAVREWEATHREYSSTSQDRTRLDIAVVIGRKTKFIYGVDAIQSLSLAVVYLGKALERIRPKIRRDDRWLTELFPILVPNLPPDLPAKVDRLIEKETKAQLRRFEARAKKRRHRRCGTKRRQD